MTNTYAWGTMPEMFGPRHEHRLGLILKETARFPQGARVLEAAVGLGQLAARLRDQGHRVVGIDASLDAVRYVRDTLGLPVVLGDLTKLPFRDGAFDAVTSGETLEHLDEDAPAVREFGRVVREQGSAVVTVPALESLRTFSDEYYEHRRRYSREQLSALFEKAGFRVTRAAFWGFPVVLAYDTFFILPMNRRRARRAAGEDQTIQGVARMGKSRALVTFVRWLFATDRWFRFVPAGVGLVLTASKRRGGAA